MDIEYDRLASINPMPLIASILMLLPISFKMITNYESMISSTGCSFSTNSKWYSSISGYGKGLLRHMVRPLEKPNAELKEMFSNGKINEIVPGLTYMQTIQVNTDRLMKTFAISIQYMIANFRMEVQLILCSMYLIKVIEQDGHEIIKFLYSDSYIYIKKENDN